MGHPRVSHPGIDVEALRAQVPRRIEGRWYRTVKDKRRRQVESPAGSAVVAGRYHTTDEDQVLYLSDSPGLSVNESTRLFQTVPLRESAWYNATFEIGLARVLDLADPRIVERLGLTTADLVQPRPGGYLLTQAIARQARAAGCEAIRAPSARPGISGSNLVIFLEVVEETGGVVSLATDAD